MSRGTRLGPLGILGVGAVLAAAGALAVRGSCPGGAVPQDVATVTTGEETRPARDRGERADVGLESPREEVRAPAVGPADEAEGTDVSSSAWLGGTLRVRVLDDATGSPVPDVPVAAVLATGEDDPRFVVAGFGPVETDALGHAALAVETERDVRGAALYVGLAREPPRGSIETGRWFLVGETGFRWLPVTRPADGEAVDAVLRVRRAFHVAGRVLDGEGRPLPGARFDRMLIIEDAAGGSEWRQVATEARSGADGRFLLEPVVPVDGARRLLVRVFHPDWLDRAERTVEAPFAPLVDLGDVVLSRRGVALVGRLVRPDGSPAAGRRVVLLAAGDIVHEGRTDEDGRFRFGGLEAGEGILLAPGACLGGGRSLHLSWTGDVAEKDLGTLLAGEGSLPVRGIVVDGDGRPVGGAAVRAIGPAWVELESTTTDEEGRFALHACATDERFEVRASREFGEADVRVAQLREVSPAAGEVRLVLRPGSSLLIVLEGADGSTPHDVRIDAWRVGIPPGRLVRDGVRASLRAGRVFRQCAMGLKPGRWRVRVVVDGGVPLEREVEIEDSELDEPRVLAAPVRR